MPNVDNLNFKVILDDKEFNTRIKADIDMAQKLNAQLSTLLQAKVNVTKISAQEAASAKRHSEILTKQALDHEKIRKAAALSAEAEERVRTQAARTANELEKAKKTTAETALLQQRLATEMQRTKGAMTGAAVQSQRLATEQQRTRTEAERTNKEVQNVVNATARAALSQKRLTDYTRSATSEYAKQSRLINELKGYALGYLSIHGVTSILSSMVRITGEFELQKTTLAAMLQDMGQAESIMTKIQGLAVESPFTFSELSTYTKQLSAFSVPAQELFETTKMLADVSAGLGVSMDRIVLAYGQVRSAAFLRGQEVRQFTEAGIPILDELAKQFSELEGRAVSAGEVFDKISARLVPFEMVSKVLQDLTSEGGKFYEMQSIQSETLRGRVLKLKDAYQIMLNEIGSSKSEKMKGALDVVMNMMKNWERVGNILKTIIVTYGAYKAALASVYLYEKLLAGAELYKKWQRMNQLLVATTGQTKKVSSAMRVLGISAKAAAGIAVGALAGIVTILVTAIRNATELNRELNKIVASELSGSDKMVTELDALVGKLRDASRGSQEYREAITVLNNKYGDYLPKIFSEADAFSAVETAANAAAEAIRNKARAQAYEKGTMAIEEKYGKGLTELADGIENTLMFIDPNIPKKAATEFVKFFKDTLKTYNWEGDYMGAFDFAYSNFFGKDNLTTLLEQANGKIKNYSSLTESMIESYGEMLDKIDRKQSELEDKLDLRFGGSTYSSQAEMNKLEQINRWYKVNENYLKGLVLSQDEYNERLQEINIIKLERLVAAYKGLGRLDVAKMYQEQLDALTETADGWRGKVQEVLTGLGLNKGTSFGLWAEDTTQSTVYVDDMIKRYKELKEEIARVSSFDTEQTNRLKKNKKAIEAVAKALKINLEELSKKDTGKSQGQIDLEIQIDLVKKLQDAYEKLVPFISGDQMGKTLSELFPEAKAEWLESFDFSGVLDKLADDLAKYDKEASKKLKASIGKDVATSLANAFKEVEAYKKMIDEWMGEDFNLEGEGVKFDVNKIIRDLNNQYAQIDQKRLKALELLKKAEEGDAKSVAMVRALLGEETWQKYLENGKEVIDELARKEKESAKKTADEKIRDKSDAYLNELFADKGIDMSELNEKTMKQLRDTVSVLENARKKVSEEMGNLLVELMQGDFSEEQYARYQMLAEVLKQIGIDIEKIAETTDKKSRKNAVKMASDVTDAFSTLGKEISSLGAEIDNTFLAGLGQSMENIGGFAKDMISNVKVLTEELEGLDMENLTASDLTDAAKGGIIGIISSSVNFMYTSVRNSIVKAYEEQVKVNEATREYEQILADIRRESYSGVFGTDEMALAAENQQILADAQKDYNEAMRRFQNERADLYNKRNYSVQWDKTVESLLSDFASADGWDLYRENGELNLDAMKAYYESYAGDLTSYQKEMVDALIASYDALNDASAQSAEYMTSLFSSAADTIAEKMVGAFIESGDAATDLSDVVSDVASQMASDLIKTLYIMPILNQYAKDLEAIAENNQLSADEKTAAALGILQTGVEQIKDNEDAINATLAELDEFFVREDEGTKDLGEGIKGITEDQANLLASYLNAIRADVSYSKALWVKMDSNLQRIADMLTSSPSLMEYQAQIAANTYNTAVATQEILSELRGVISFDTGDAAIRVNS